MNARLTDWNGRRVWIVGASSGIGAALAEALLARGARVAISGRSGAVLRQREQANPAAWALPLDATQPADVAAAWEAILARWERVDLVVCMAGTYAPTRAWELSAQSAHATVEANLLSAINVAAAVLPEFLRRGAGAIAIVASVAGYRGLPKALVYGPTKAALINFAEALYLDLRPKGISVFLVCPGFVATPLTAQNDFRMPALISADEAARHMLDGFARGVFEIHFPRRFTLGLKFLRLLPYRLYFPAVRRLTGR